MKGTTLIGIIIVLGGIQAVFGTQIDNKDSIITIERPITATDQERQEGYFLVGDPKKHGDDMYLVVKPGSDLYDALVSKMEKKTVRITIQ